MHHNRPRYPALTAILIVLALLGSACAADATPAPTPTFPPLIIITSTLPATPTLHPSDTPVPPTATVPAAPVEGQTTSQLNVRSAPSAESDLLGQLPILTKVQIVGKDPSNAWWMIVYPQSPNGTGWVTAQYVQATGTENVPVFNSQPAGNAGGASPTLEAGAGKTVQPGSAAATTPESNLSLASAFEDGDSSQAPAVSITLTKTSVRSFNYSSDLSSPAGDLEDWVQFKLDGTAGQKVTVTVVFNCTGSGTLSVELIQGSSALQNWQEIACGHPSQLILSLFVGAPYNLRIMPAQANNIQKYINYTVIVSLQ